MQSKGRHELQCPETKERCERAYNPRPARRNEKSEIHTYHAKLHPKASLRVVLACSAITFSSVTICIFTRLRILFVLYYGVPPTLLCFFPSSAPQLAYLASLLRSSYSFQGTACEARVTSARVVRKLEQRFEQQPLQEPKDHRTYHIGST
jgi:hypothetical protein